MKGKNEEEKVEEKSSREYDDIELGIDIYV